MGKKHKLLRAEWVGNRFREGEFVKVARVKALRDIPLHGVKKGDLGGWVELGLEPILSQNGECWVGQNAIIFGSVHVADNALVAGNAIIHGGVRVKRGDVPEGYYYGVSITGNAKIIDDARIDYFHGTGMQGNGGFIGQYAIIRGKAAITGARSISGETVVEGNASVAPSCTIGGEIVIKDQARIGKSVHIGGWAEISKNAQIGNHSNINGATKIGDDAIVLPYSTIKDGKLIKNPESPARELVEYVASNRNERTVAENIKFRQEAWDTYFRKYEEIKEKITAYSTDIVSILKYPIMTDLTNVHTAEMMFALKKVELETGLHQPESFFPTVENLEMKFLVAESNARKIAASIFSDSDRKKTEQARDLFALACNEASPEPEKRNAFKQGFRKLEGVVAIPDEAIQAMRIRVGIPELEM